MINDGVTAGLLGGVLNAAVDGGEAACAGQNLKAAYIIGDGVNTGENAYHLVTN